MVEFADQPFRIRSNSMPSTSHPTTLRVEDELHKVRTNLSSSSRTMQIMCDGLRGVGDLYKLIGEFLCLPSNQQSLHPCQKKWVEKQLDDSLKMLDLIGAVKDCIVAMREHVQDLHSTLRRKRNSVVSTKKAQKLIKDCLRSLKRMDGKSVTFSSVSNKESDMLVQASTEARESTVSLLQSIISFLRKPQQNVSRWSIVSKAISKRRVACEGECEGATEEDSADMFLKASYDCMACKDVDAVQVLKAQDHLKSLEIRVESLESGLDCLFRRLMQNRVSLLNLLGL